MANFELLSFANALRHVQSRGQSDADRKYSSRGKIETMSIPNFRINHG